MAVITSRSWGSPRVARYPEVSGVAVPTATTLCQARPEEGMVSLHWAWGKRGGWWDRLDLHATARRRLHLWARAGLCLMRRRTLLGRFNMERRVRFPGGKEYLVHPSLLEAEREARSPPGSVCCAVG